MNPSPENHTRLNRPVLLAVAGIVLFLIGCGDAMRRQAVWNDTITTLGERIPANHMSFSPGTIVYLDENGGSHGFAAPFFGSPDRGARVDVEFRRSDPAGTDGLRQSYVLRPRKDGQCQGAPHRSGIR